MARYKRTNTNTQWKRVGNRMVKTKKTKNTEKGNNPAKVTDEQIIMAEKDPAKRESMFKALQQGKTRRSLARNLTTQGITLGGQASSSVVATKALGQNISGGVKQTETGRKDPEDDEEPEGDPVPPVY